MKYQSLDDSTPQAATWTPEATSANARKVSQDESGIAYIGEFNSGATAVSLPILNEGGRRDGQPGQLGGRPHPEGPRLGAGRAREVLAERGPHLLAHRADRPRPGRGHGAADEGRGLHLDLHPQRQGGLRDRPGQEHRPGGRRPGDQGRRQRGDRPQGGELPLARGPDALGRRRLLRLRRDHGEQRRAAVQGHRDRQPRREGDDGLGRGRRDRRSPIPRRAGSPRASPSASR